MQYFFLISCLFFASVAFFLREWCWFSAFISLVSTSNFSFLLYISSLLLYNSVFYFSIILWTCLCCSCSCRCCCQNTLAADALLHCSCAKWFNLGANSLANRCTKKNSHIINTKVPDGKDEGATKNNMSPLNIAK